MTSVLVLIAAFPLTSLLSYFLKSSLILWIPFQFPSWSGSLLSFLITNILHYLFSYVKSFCCLTFPIKTLAACPSGSNNLWLRLTLLSKCFSVLGCMSCLYIGVIHIGHIICKYFPPFNRLSFCFLSDFLYCAKAFNFI